MLDVRDVAVAFDGHPVLRGVSLTAADGEVVGLLGGSGSGKSTLLRVIAGLIEPDRGSVHLAGRDVTRVPTHERGVGMVFQDEQLFPHRDVAQNIAFGLRMAGRPAPEQAARVAELLALVGLPGFERRRVTDLSGGEAKRVALARSLAPRPRVLLLDEPLTGLDRELHDRLTSELGTILRSEGTTSVLVTHDREEAATVADRVVRLEDINGPGPAGESLPVGADRAVVEITAAAAHPLRRRVLRDGTATTAVALTDDDEPGVVHLGVADERGELIGVSTWLPRAWAGEPDRPAVQLRMMATDPAVRGDGIGRRLLAAGVERAFASGAELVWANARDSALGFYERFGFDVVGDGFVTDDTGLPHHVIVRRR